MKKSFFSSVYIIDITFDEYFLFHVLTSTIFYKSLPLFWGDFPTTMLLRSLKQVFWKNSVFEVIPTITVRFYYQSSTLNLSDIIPAKLPYFFFFDDS